MAKMNSASSSATKAVAEKIANGSSAKAQTAIQSPSLAVGTKGDNLVVVPGLREITPDIIPAMMPHFDSGHYRIEDPLNPPDTLPQANESQFNRGMTIYQGAQRALKLVGAAMDTTREKFTVVGKHAKAVGAGIASATEIEKVKGHYLDYQSQLQVTQQKGIGLDIAQVKTVVDRNVAVHSKEELNQKLTQASIKTQDSQLKTIESQEKLNAFKNQLGEYLPK